MRIGLRDRRLQLKKNHIEAIGARLKRKKLPFQLGRQSLCSGSIIFAECPDHPKDQFPLFAVESREFMDKVSR